MFAVLAKNSLSVKPYKKKSDIRRIEPSVTPFPTPRYSPPI